MDYTKWEGVIKGVKVAWTAEASERLMELSNQQQVPFPMLKSVTEVHAAFQATDMAISH
jgi:hypothetical protein